MKTPLFVIESYAAALQDTELTEESKREYIDAIIESSQRLGMLVSNILKLDKLENQVILSSEKPYDLCRQLADCALGFEGPWEHKHIDFTADLEDRAMVRADPDMLELVWNNLLSNAVKFTATGGRVSLTQTSDESHVIVDVSETGCSMSEEEQTHVFGRFYQADTSRNCEGNGLGLALARRAVEVADGTISVMSKVGEGSTFTVVLPVRI